MTASTHQAIERFNFTPWHSTIPAFCRLDIYPATDAPTLVICTEHPENTGMSVTNAAEALATKVVADYELEPGRTLFVEHYLPIPVDPDYPQGPEADSESYAMVILDWSPNGVASNPRWSYLSHEQVETLIGREPSP